MVKWRLIYTKQAQKDAKNSMPVTLEKKRKKFSI